jgi:metal-responsive CopG/Arc/MetJ family transcriptional regulator
MIKVTFTLDDESVAYLDRMADRLAKPKSQVVREALRLYGEHMSRLTEEERTRMLGVFDAVTPAIPDRPRKEVEEELEALRQARRAGGRGASDPPSKPG